jgi:hypothetical protein
VQAAGPAESIKSARFRAQSGRFAPKRSIFGGFGSVIPANWAVGRHREFDQIWRLRCIGRPPLLEQSLYDGHPAADRFDGPMMTDESDKTARRAAESRQDRLKSALRENLKRRKAQARERAEMTTDPSHNDDASLDEGIAGKTGG